MKIGVDGFPLSSRLAGIGNYTYGLLRPLAEMMPDCEFVVFTYAPLVKEVDLDLPNIRIEIASSRMWESPYLWKLHGLAKQAAGEKIDVFWASSGILPFRMPCRVVQTVYDFVYRIEGETMTWIGRLFRSLSQPYWIKQADKVITISQAVDAEMGRFYGRAADAVIKPAANDIFVRKSVREIEDVRMRYGVTRDYVLIVGTREPRKNLTVFINAYLEFANKLGSGIPLLLITGGVGWKDASIARALNEAEQRGVAKAIGYVDIKDLPAIYSGAMIFFMPSRYEGFGMPVLEARMCGCRVVCSDIPAMREAGGNGAHYHAPTPRGIAAALEKLLIRGELPEPSSGRDVDWSWETGAKQLGHLLREVGAMV